MDCHNVISLLYNISNIMIVHNLLQTCTNKLSPKNDTVANSVVQSL